jgi:hypothetical protein
VPLDEKGIRRVAKGMAESMFDLHTCVEGNDGYDQEKQSRYDKASDFVGSLS